MKKLVPFLFGFFGALTVAQIIFAPVILPRD